MVFFEQTLAGIGRGLDSICNAVSRAFSGSAIRRKLRSSKDRSRRISRQIADHAPTPESIATLLKSTSTKLDRTVSDGRGGRIMLFTSVIAAAALVVVAIRLWTAPRGAEGITLEQIEAMAKLRQQSAGPTTRTPSTGAVDAGALNQQPANPK